MILKKLSLTKLDVFKTDLTTLEAKQIIRKWLLSGSAHVLTDDEEFELKDRTAEHFSVEYSEVTLVGSGKLGFSLVPGKRYRSFGDESDLDLAIISERLFTKVWKEAYIYKKSGAYWPKSSKFFQYLSSGWIRPDKLPLSTSFSFSEEWWDYFNNLTSSQDFGPYKIRGGLYHSWFFFFQYQMKCIEQCQNDLLNENISNK